MKLGIIGTGNVGAALCKSLTRKGYRVMIGSRSLEKATALAGQMEHYAQGGTIANAIHFGEIIILAIPYKAVEETLRNTDSLRGKIIIDCTNPFIFGEKVELALGHTTSAAEQIQRMVPEARVVKAFNTATARQMEHGPFFGPSDGSMFYCGDDADAKSAVAKLIEATGFIPIDCGALENARLLEPMALMLVRLAFTQGMGDDIAFKLLTRD
ncbi:MAG: hypothetical protein D6722_18375 [Bacteroidetes bacterium]|nr:MAG: hypothetical protein D6722_18375 [Bacteroidota bacterium]